MTETSPNENELLNLSLAGDLNALEKLVRGVQKKVFNLSLKFLWNPEDAEDATQEILIKTITNLGSFRRESAFSTWVYRIAVNHLINAKKSRTEQRRLTFRIVRSELQKTSIDVETSSDTSYLASQVKTACTHAMLTCLKRQHRIAFILGEVVQVSGDEGAEIMGIPAANFRKKLSRARKRMGNFLGTNCGVVNSGNVCRCETRISYSIRNFALKPYLDLSERLKESGEWKRIETYSDETDLLERVSLTYRSTMDYDSRRNTLEEVKSIFSKKNLRLLS
ncbi:RNA polymerase sigma factor [Leptospira gomenensis]|uniref:RNA polymerase sigma factor n=1 Tax=Leptospira gomenensis TaxID=2484974 RepID=A0A5F1Y7Z2_9LEPT|nr:RNA polymerase sigma factor [Leptospira gomenensis]TGK28955.1 RNA polymerase sigma factor [Leptospira gomenensis]TGK35416.1 RNA polymerase sigma factor [Leptospira gomenensis]TGK40714.1 RNA polymerase sigma factor [Leptospira gomenensis]TGK68442.1 RNA polymerase sigma factor [Leptospira gomenensis]